MVVHMTAAPRGCGRDLYIFMRPEVTQGKTLMSRSDGSGRSRAIMNRDMLIVESEKRRRQKTLSDRLSTPSPRQ